MGCIFCRIVAGEIPCHKIYEDKDFLAFLDIKPRNPGHTLVIPKKHYRWVWDTPQIGQYFLVVKKIVRALRKSLNTQWVVSLVLGEEVPHAHVWLVPRFADDGHGGSINLGLIKDIPLDKMEEIAEKIKRNL